VNEAVQHKTFEISMIQEVVRLRQDAEELRKDFDRLFQAYADLRYRADQLSDEIGIPSDDLFPPVKVVLPPRSIVW
jgi:uncharacterized coiled-coil DUF342 family protein